MGNLRPVELNYGKVGIVCFVFDTLGQLYGLEKFWAYLKYSKAKNLDIDPKLQEYLGKFKRLEDFRVDVSTSFNVKLPTVE